MALKFFPAHPRKRVVLLSLLLRLIKLFKCSASEERTPSAFLCSHFVFGSCFVFGCCSCFVFGFDVYWSCLWSLRKNLKMVPSMLAPLSQSSLKELGSAAPFLALLPRDAVRSWQGRTAAVAKVWTPGQKHTLPICLCVYVPFCCMPMGLSTQLENRFCHMLSVFNSHWSFFTARNFQKQQDTGLWGMRHRTISKFGTRWTWQQLYIENQK